MHSITSRLLSGALTVGCLGWYLMLPPQTGKYTLDENKPIHEWYEDSGYDTAVECQARITNLLTVLREHADINHRGMLYQVYDKAVCVETNDPRLAARK